MKDRTLAACVLGFLIAFLYQMSEIFAKHACFCDWKQPPAWGEVFFAIVMGLGAIGAAAGLNLPNLVAGFTKGQQQP